MPAATAQNTPNTATAASTRGTMRVADSASRVTAAITDLCTSIANPRHGDNRDARAWSKANQHGQTAQTEVIGSLQYVHRKRMKTFQVLWCPVTIEPSLQRIASFRAFYTEWWFAVSYVRLARRPTERQIPA